MCGGGGGGSPQPAPPQIQPRNPDLVRVSQRPEKKELLDEDEVRLKPFNVVVQRGTNHAWVNNGNEPALLIAVLIDSDLKDTA